MDATQAKFEGWAVVELFGHQKEAGFVSTQYFGDKAMFQIDVPEIPEREVVLKHGQYLPAGLHGEDGTRWVDAGTKVLKAAIAGRSKLVSPGAVYALNPCTEEVVRKMADVEGRAIKIVSLPPENQLTAGEEPEGDDDLDDED